MNINTQALLDELSRFPWFEHVGEPEEANVVWVRSWSEAVNACKSQKWESVQLQVRNHLSYVVNTKNYDRFLQWNKLTVEMNERIDAVIMNPVKQVTRRFGLAERFAECVAWDITVSCQEVEFSDVCPPIFFLNNVLPWYRRGHIPCGWQGPELPPGWEGPMPQGRLIVY